MMHSFIARYRFPVILSTAFLDLLGVGVLIPVLPDILRFFFFSWAWAGYSQALYALSTFLVAFWIGWISDRRWRRPMIFLTSFANALWSFLLLLSLIGVLSLHTAIILFLISRFVSWVSGAWFGVVQAMISDIAPREERTKYFGLMGATFGLAFLIGPFIGGVLSVTFWLMSIPVVMLAAACINLLSIYFILPETHNPSLKNTTQDFVRASLIRDDHGLLLLFVLSAGVVFAFSIMTTLSSQYYWDLFRMNAHDIALVFSWIGLTSIIYQGAVTRHLRSRWSHQTLLTASLLLFIASFLWFASMNKEWMVYIWMILMPVAMWTLNPTLNSLLTIGREYESGRIMGINMSVTGAANVLGPVLGAMMYAYSIRLPFFFGAIVFLVLLWLFLIGSRWIFSSKSSR